MLRKHNDYFNGGLSRDRSAAFLYCLGTPRVCRDDKHPNGHDPEPGDDQRIQGHVGPSHKVNIDGLS